MKISASISPIWREYEQANQACLRALFIEHCGSWLLPHYTHYAIELVRMMEKLGVPENLRVDLNIANMAAADNFVSLLASLTNRSWRQDLHLPPLMGCVMSAMYAGERKLEYIPLELMKEYYSIVYDIAKHMLEVYGLYEE